MGNRLDRASAKGVPWCADCGTFTGPFVETRSPWMVLCADCAHRLGHLPENTTTKGVSMTETQEETEEQTEQTPPTETEPAEGGNEGGEGTDGGDGSDGDSSAA